MVKNIWIIISFRFKKPGQSRQTAEIFNDRNGVLLAYNELAYSITIEDNSEYTGSEKNRELNKEIGQIIEIVESNGDSVISNFNVVLDSNNEYQSCKE